MLLQSAKQRQAGLLKVDSVQFAKKRPVQLVIERQSPGQSSCKRQKSCSEGFNIIANAKNAMKANVASGVVPKATPEAKRKLCREKPAAASKSEPMPKTPAGPAAKPKRARAQI